MAIAEYADFDGLGLAELVRNRDVKPIELADEAIRRAEKLNPKLNCVVFKDYDRARDAARGDLPKGPFSGVPFFLKDIYALAEGMPTRQAAGFMPPVSRRRIVCWSRATEPPGSSCWARPTCRNSASCRRRNRNSTAPRTIP